MGRFAVIACHVSPSQHPDGLEEMLGAPFAAAGVLAQTHFQLSQTHFQLAQTQFQLEWAPFELERWASLKVDEFDVEHEWPGGHARSRGRIAVR